MRKTTPRPLLLRAGLSALALGALLAARLDSYADVLLWNAPGGNWDSTSLNWLNAGNPTNWNNTTPDAADFGATGVGTVNLNEAITAASITFDTAGYTIAGNTLTLGGVSPSITNNASATISSVLAGTAGLTKAGAGTLTLSGINTYTGITTISQGVLALNKSPVANTPFSWLASGINLGDANTGPNLAKLTLSAGMNTTDVTVSLVTCRQLGAITVTSAAGSTNAVIDLTTAGANPNFNLILNGPVKLTGAKNQSLFHASGPGAGAGNDTLIIDAVGSSQVDTADGTASTFSGNVHVISGRWQMQNNAYIANDAAHQNLCIPDTASVILDAGTSWSIVHGAETIDGLFGSGSASWNSGSSLGQQLVMGGGNNANGGYFTGTLNGSTTVGKIGTGTQILAGPNISYTGTTLISNGTLSLSNCTAWASAITNNSPGALELNSPGAWTFGKAITGTGGLTKLGAGTMTFSVAQSYTGPTLVKAGALYANAPLSATSAITVSNNATYGGRTTNGTVTVAPGGAVEGGQAGVGTLMVSNLTFNGAGTLTVSPAASYLPLNITNNLAVGGTVTVFIANVPAFSSTNHILQSANAPAGFGNFVLAPSRNPFSLATNGNFLDLVVGPSSALVYPIWTGAFDSTWSTGGIPSPKNWKLNTDSSATDFLPGDSVYFDDSATTTTPTLSAANVSPSSTTFNNTNKNYTLTGSFGIANGSLIKRGPGLLTISNANSYASGTTLSNGTVAFASGGLGSGTVTMAGNSTLRWLNGNTAAVPLALGNGITATLDTGTNSVSESTALAGTGTRLVKTGAGALTLGAASTYSGGTTLSQGTLTLNNATSASTGAITLGDANTGANNVQLNLGAASIANPITVANQGSGTVTIASTVQFQTFSAGITLNKDVTLSSPNQSGAWYSFANVGGTGNVTWLTPGNSRFNSGACSFVGSNSVQGLIQVQDPATFGNLNNSVTLSGSGQLHLYSAGVNIGALNGAGLGIYAGTGVDTRTINLGNGGGSGVFSGPIYEPNTGKTVGLTKNGAGTQTLSGTNTYTGPTAVNTGTLIIDPVGSLGNTAVTVASGASLAANGTLGGAAQSAGRLYGTGTINGAVTVQSGGTLAPGANNAAIGALTLGSSLTELNGATTVIKISKNTGSIANDAVNFSSSTTVTYGGVLVVTNLTTDGSPLLPTDIFPVFNPTNFSFLTYTGSFVMNPANLPTPPAGYSWDASFLTVDGTLRFGNFVVPPVFSPAGGGYVGAQAVTITCATPNSTIHYSTDGWVTTNTYTGPIQLPASANVTFQAYATAPSMTPSGPASATYMTEPVAIWVLTNSTFGLWSATNNWTNGIIPNNPNATADFSQLDLSVVGGDASISPNGSSWTVGQMIFGDKGSNYNWSLGAGGTITLDASNTPVINVLNKTTTIDATLDGSKGLTKTGNGTLVLDVANTYSGGTVVSQGKLTLNNLTAVGNGTIILGDANTGTNDVTLGLGFNSPNDIVVSNTGTGSVTIDYTLTGGNLLLSPAFTLNRPTTINAPGISTATFNQGISGSVQTLTLNGPATGGGLAFFNTLADTFTGTVVLASGNMTTWPDGIPPTSPVVVQAASAIYYLGDAHSEVTRIDSLSGQGTVTVSAQGGATSNPQTLSLGNANGSGDFAGSITNGNQTISIIKVGSGTETFSGTNTYTGSTTVSNGTLLINGSLAAGSTVYVAPGSTLGGNGVIGGPVTVDGTLSPGASIGTLTLNSNLTLTGNVLIQVDKALAQSNDIVNVTGTLTYGGTLTGVNIGATPLVAGDSFQVFPAGGSGNVTLAGSPGAGLAWSFNPATGVLSVVSSVSTTPPHLTNSVSGGNVNLSWPADHLGWRLETQTNPRSIGLSNNWVTVPGSTNVTSMSIPVSPAYPTVFYRLVYP
jgi:autotransporter-associated beta strand protein